MNIKNNTINEPEEYNKISITDKQTVEKWIKEHILSQKKPNNRHTSYGIKHLFEEDKENSGFYMSNGEFKGALLACGFKPVNEHIMNWKYCISEKSPAFTRK